MVGRSATAKQGEHQFNQSWSHNRWSTYNERSCAANLPYVILPTSSAAGHPGSLSSETCTALVHAFVSSRLDYCNSLLAGVSNELINKLQSVLRSAARLVLRKRKFDPITDDLRHQLHWLPIRQRIKYKLGVIVYKCLRGDAPSYLTGMISPVGNGCQRLRSAAHGDLAVPRTRTVRMGPRSWPNTKELAAGRT